MKSILAILLLTSCMAWVHAAEQPTGQAGEPETRFVAKSARVALLQAPTPEAVILMRLTPGEEIAVLGREAGFINVRTISGMEGWLAASDVTAETPAENLLLTANTRIEELEATVANLQRQLRNAQAQARQASQRLGNTEESAAAEVTRLQEALENTGSELAALRERNAALQSELAEYEMAEESRQLLAGANKQGNNATPRLEEFRWTMAVIAAALLLAGFVSGYVLKTRRVRARFRGLDI